MYINAYASADSLRKLSIAMIDMISTTCDCSRGRFRYYAVAVIGCFPTLFAFSVVRSYFKYAAR